MTARKWTLELRAPTPMRSTNAFRRMHWRPIAAERRTWRELACAEARRAKLPTAVDRVRIDAVLHFTDRRPRDEANYYDALKPVVDACGAERKVRDDKQVTGWRVEPGHGLIVDDTPAHLDGPYLTIGEPVDKRRFPFGRMNVTIIDLSDTNTRE